MFDYIFPIEYIYIKKKLYIYTDYYFSCARFLWRYVNPTNSNKLPDLEDAFFLRKNELSISLRSNIPENSKQDEKFYNIKSVFSKYKYSMKGNGSLIEFDIYKVINEINLLEKQVIIVRNENTHHGFFFLKDNYNNPIKKNEILNILADYMDYKKISDCNYS
jgi:hypothetical protein